MTGASSYLYEHDSHLYLKVNLLSFNKYAFFRVLENHNEQWVCPCTYLSLDTEQSNDQENPNFRIFLVICYTVKQTQSHYLSKRTAPFHFIYQNTSWNIIITTFLWQAKLSYCILSEGLKNELQAWIKFRRLKKNMKIKI